MTMSYAAISKAWRTAPPGRDDWDEVGDIGQEFFGEKLEAIRYIEFEISMVATVVSMFAENHASEFVLMGSVDYVQPEIERGRVSAIDVPAVIVRMLRGADEADMRLEHEACLVHPGYDSRLYLGSEAGFERTREVAEFFGLRFDDGFTSSWLHTAAEEGTLDRMHPWPREVPE